MARIEELRLITKVARLYYEQGLRQIDIVNKLGISQTTISRILKRAEREGIVRITIVSPPGVHSQLEDQLQNRYGLNDCIVVDTTEEDNEDRLLHRIGRAAAYFVETALRPGDVVGISSWSRALLAMMDDMQGRVQPARAEVVQILGGIGNPAADVRASQLTRDFARSVNGQAVFLPAPGVVRSAVNRRFFLEDQYVVQAMQQFPRVTLALVGIGAVGSSAKLSSSGVVFSDEELAIPRAAGAAGDVCLRFYDRDGKPVPTELDEWVIGITLDQLRTVKRSVGVAGGRRKVSAIRGALKGGWINGLITDRITAERLLRDS